MTFSVENRNCKVCCKDAKRELRFKSYYSAPQCSVYLYCTNGKTALPFDKSKVIIVDYIKYFMDCLVILEICLVPIYIANM